MLQDDGTFIIRGDACLGNCDTNLDLKMDEEEPLKKFATHSGFFCMCGGEILGGIFCHESRMVL